MFGKKQKIQEGEKWSRNILNQLRGGRIKNGQYLELEISLHLQTYSFGPFLPVLKKTSSRGSILIKLNRTKESESVSYSVVSLCSPVDCSWPSSSVHGIFPGKNTGVGSHFLLQGIFLAKDRTQVSCIAGRFFTIWVPGEALNHTIDNRDQPQIFPLGPSSENV